MDEMTAHQLLMKALATLAQDGSVERIGSLRVLGPVAGVNVLLGNGQTFRIQIEETTGQ